MDKGEARALLNQHLESYRSRSHADLVALIGTTSVAVVRGPSGTEYQIEIEVMQDSPRDKNVYVIGSIDDGRLPGALSPLSESFIVAPGGS